MVKQEQWNGKTVYLCEICNFAYETKELAQQCEDFCKKNNACSIEITKEAIRRD